jgi:hypothetical protein
MFFPACWLVGSTPKIFSTKRKNLISDISGAEVVMIGKVEGEKNMVVIERVDDYIYSMCTLKKDLKVKDVRMAAKASKDKYVNHVSVVDEAREVDGGEWWRKMMVRNKHSADRHPVSLRFFVGKIGPEYSRFRSMLISGRYRRQQ